MVATTPVADHLNRIGYRAAIARGRLHPAFAEWTMGLPPAETLSRTARIRLAGNAVIARQAALMLTRGLEQLDATDRKELS